MIKLFALIRKSETGATAIEYGLIAALVAIAAIVGMQAVGTELQTTFTAVDTALSAANAP